MKLKLLLALIILLTCIGIVNAKSMDLDKPAKELEKFVKVEPKYRNTTSIQKELNL